MNNQHKPYGTYEKYFKRLLDVFCSLAALLVFWWLYIIVAVLVRIKLGSPVLFKQERPGKNEEIFKLYKFRTMTDARDENGNLLPDEVRLTKFGRALRATSLDELPEVFNILKGEMSLVGPRPIIQEELERYGEFVDDYLMVKPGITGMWQVSGRSDIEYAERVQLDTWYVRDRSVCIDVVMLFKTYAVVLMRKGAY